MVLTLAGIALTALIAWAAWFHFSRRAREVAGPMRIIPFTSFPGHQDEARFSPDGNQIAFSWGGETEDNRDIYVKLIGTEKPLRLTTTTHPGEDHYPAWSPDGRSIAFWRYDSKNEAGIYVVPALGGPERRLHTMNLSGLDLDWDESLDWSPDGKYLAYSEGRGGQRNPTIFLLAVDTPDNIRLLIKQAGQTEDCSPRFSPDGRNVAFVRWMGQPAHDIFVVPLAGGEPKRLTFDNGFIRGLAWTPDGAYVIFSSNRLGGTFRLWKVPPRGGQPEPLPVGQGGAFYPTLSRDGRRLAYTQRDSNINIWRCEVPRATRRSAPPTKLIASTYSSLSPQFSPDGKRIVFTSDRSGGWEIWVCDSDGSNPQQLTFFEGPAVCQPHWSPDGRQIAFDSSAEGRGAVYVVSVEGGRPRRLTAGASDDGVPTWSRDGKWIYFASDRTGAVQTWKMPAEGGQAVQVTKKGGYVAFESPDGKILYYAKGYADPGLWKVPVGGGEETPVLEQLAEGYRWAWGLGGEGIYFYNASTKAIELLNFATHRITQIAKPEKPVWTVAVSPDGRWILYDQLDQNTSKIMLVENFRW
jgi:Tol biopolymer transport system component